MKYRYAIIDLGVVFNKYHNHSSLYSLFNKYPLKEIVENIFTISPYIDYSDITFMEIENRFTNEEMDQMDTGSLDLLFGNITFDIDARISEMCASIEFEMYVLDRWIGKSTAVIKFE